MQTVSLTATPRAERGRALNRLRKAGSIPAIVYGHNLKPVAITVERRAFERAYAAAGESTLVSLAVEGSGELKTLIKEVARDPVTDVPTHVDFMKINLQEKLETAIPIEVTGEAPAVKTHGGVLVHALTHLRVRCLPSALVHGFTIDVSTLEEIGASILVKDVRVPADIEVLEDAEATVVTVSITKVEEAAPAAAEVTPGEVPTTEQKEGEATPEGEKKDEKKDEKKKD